MTKDFYAKLVDLPQSKLRAMPLCLVASMPCIGNQSMPERPAYAQALTLPQSFKYCFEGWLN